MTRKPTVTRRQAEKVLAAVKEMYPDSAEVFTLYDADHEEMPPGCWSIAAEGVYSTDEWPFEVIERAFLERKYGRRTGSGTCSSSRSPTGALASTPTTTEKGA